MTTPAEAPEEYGSEWEPEYDPAPRRPDNEEDQADLVTFVKGLLLEAIPVR